MENYNLTPADVALMTKHHDRSAMAATGIGLGAGLGGGALLLALGLGWGINQASKARARAAEQVSRLPMMQYKPLPRFRTCPNCR